MAKHYEGVRRRGRRTFQIRFYDADGVRQEETVKAASAKEAASIRTTRLADVANGIPIASKPNRVLFGELAADVVKHYIVNEHRSTADIEARYRVHILPVFEKRRASTITTAHITAYAAMRKDEGAKPGTINRELEAIRRAFNLALSGRKLLYAPKVPRLREDNTRSGFLTRAQVDALCRHLKAPLDSFVWFAFLTGWRYSEIQDLEWRNVDLERGEIRIDVGADKNREGRVFPMSAELRGLLESLTSPASNTRPARRHVVIAPSMPATLTPYVFVIRGRKIGAFRKTWRNACHKAGLPCVVTKEGRVIKTLVLFHDLRRSFARELDTKGIRHGAIMKLAGWKTDSVFKRYNIVTDADLRDAIDILDGHESPSKAKGPPR